MANSIWFSRVIIAVMLFLAVTPSVRAQQGETHEPYAVLEKGLKVKFADLTKDELGLRCSVYLKEGYDYDGGNSTMAKSSYVHRGTRMIIDGEFFELNHHGLQVGWFGDLGSAEWIPLSEDHIDYIILEEAPSEAKK